MTAPWHNYIYKEGATTYTRRGDTGQAQFSGTNSRIVANDAAVQAHTEFSRAVIQFAPQTFDFDSAAEFVRQPPKMSSIQYPSLPDDRNGPGRII